MRKVFISTMALNPIEEDATQFVSDDYSFNFERRQYKFAISYFINEYVEDNDEVLIICTVQPNEYKGKEQKNFSEENFQLYRKEIQSITSGRENVHIHYEIINTQKDFESGHAVNLGFKRVVKLLQDEDQIYMDLTRGDKPFSITLFMAVAAVLKLCPEADVIESIYCQRYTGNRQVDRLNPTKIYNMTGLILLSALSYDFEEGEKEEFEKLLDKVIRG